MIFVVDTNGTTIITNTNTQENNTMNTTTTLDTMFIPRSLVETAAKVANPRTLGDAVRDECIVFSDVNGYFQQAWPSIQAVADEFDVSASTVSDLTAAAVQAANIARKAAGKPKMNTVVKAMWLKALRSGNYSQARSSLKALLSPEGVNLRNARTDDGPECKFGHCCLGVLAEEVGGITGKDYIFWSDVAKGMPAPEAVESWGLNQSLADDLASMNDSGRFSFADIADIIEAHL